MSAVLLVTLLVTLFMAPVAVVVVPPIVMWDARRFSLGGAWLWFAAVGLVIAWGAASSADLDRADATGGQGSILAGVGWLVAAVVAATASVLVSHRRVAVPSGTLTR